ncbi:MAG: SRPBCC family protein [Bryobacteraceae bacterium]|jgi:activator of HSP90 ATPase
MRNATRTLTGVPTRRRIINGATAALGGLAAGSGLMAEGRQESMKEVPATAANKARTSLHQEAHFKASAQRIYDMFLDSKQFAAFSGMPAEIDPHAGGAFSMFGGLIVGRNVELIPDRRIVQAWRATHWDPGIYSIVKFEFKSQGSETTVILDHTGFPEGEFDHLDPGWHEHYWDRLEKYLS